MRNIHSPDVVCAQELIVDQLAKKTGQDPVVFRGSLAGLPRSFTRAFR
jgi:isoquinoline 1-oxidoreductase beta subunit